MKITLFLLILLISSQVYSSQFDLKSLAAKEIAIENEHTVILKKAGISRSEFSYTYEIAKSGSLVHFTCSEKNVRMNIISTPSEWGATFYYGLQLSGFYFPHPRIQISPTISDIRKNCDKKFEFKPAFKYRGMHLHTLHPNEWVSGFLMGKEDIAIDTIKWIARNSQNLIDLSLLDIGKKNIIKNLDLPFRLAKNLGVHTGITMGYAFHQQNSFKLTNLFNQNFDGMSLNSIKENMNIFMKYLPLSFFNIELGTSEFTSISYKRTIKWMNESQKYAQDGGARVFIKVHVSSNQKSEKYGNFNFLPQYADKSVGVLPHTVHYFGLYDKFAPVYGNKDLSEMRDFTLKMKEERPTWYYPETSYWINLDIGVPLFLTDYLKVRALDMKNLSEAGIQGHLNFTTGNELGYWLMDWTVMLLNNKAYNFDSLIGLKLLGEDTEVWQKILDFQSQYIKDQNALTLISFSNLGDELFPQHKILSRYTLKELKGQNTLLIDQVRLLEEMMSNFPKIDKIKNEELRLLNKILFYRISHARNLRMALLYRLEKKISHSALIQAQNDRKLAKKLMNKIEEKYNRYPESFVFKFASNPTAYQFGYGALAYTTHYWLRSEYMIRDDNFSPFYLNVIDMLDIAL